MRLKINSCLSAEQVRNIIKVIPSAMPMQLSFKKKPVPVIAAGLPQIDILVGIGGFPCGRLSEIFGKESSGKTTLALHVAKTAINRGGLVLFIDGEHALDLNYIDALKINREYFILAQPSFLEEAYGAIEKFILESRSISREIPLLVIYDSVASIPPKAELEGTLETERPGLLARKTSQGLRKLVSIINKTNACVIFINQLRERINVRFGSPETTPGGKALKFYATIRLDMRQVTNDCSIDKSIESKIRIKNVKNKIAVPFKQADLFLRHGYGFNAIKSLWQQAIDSELIKAVSSRSFVYKENRISIKSLELDLELQRELLRGLNLEPKK